MLRAFGSLAASPLARRCRGVRCAGVLANMGQLGPGGVKVALGPLALCVACFGEHLGLVAEQLAELVPLAGGIGAEPPPAAPARWA
jgi:hypothetical protein